MVFSLILWVGLIVGTTGGSLALISLSLRLGQRLCARIGFSLNNSEPFSLVWAISHLLRMAPMIGGFIGLNVRIRGVFSDWNLGIFGLNRSFLSTMLALSFCGCITLLGYPRLE